MSAVLKAESIVDMIVDDVRHGAILRTYELEADHCVHFVKEQGSRVGDVMLDAMAEKYLEDPRKWDAIAERIMKAQESFDDMGDARDMLRAAMIVFCSKWARSLVERL